MSLKISSYTETKKPLRQGKGLLLSKATTGFEPVMKVLQTSALPLGHDAVNTECGRRMVNAEGFRNHQSPNPHSLERATGFEPVAFCLASRRYTT